jgi:hypothetical protein
VVPDGCDLVAAGALPVAFGTSHLALAHRAQLKSGQVGSPFASFHLHDIHSTYILYVSSLIVHLTGVVKISYRSCPIITLTIWDCTSDIQSICLILSFLSNYRVDYLPFLFLQLVDGIIILPTIHMRMPVLLIFRQKYI